MDVKMGNSVEDVGSGIPSFFAGVFIATMVCWLLYVGAGKSDAEKFERMKLCLSSGGSFHSPPMGGESCVK